MTRTRAFFLGGLAVALILAGVVSNWASSNPDGLDKVSQDLGFSEQATDHAAGSSPLADYAAKGVDNAWLSTLISGVSGVVITLAIGGLLFLALRRRSGAAPAAPATGTATTGTATTGAATTGTTTGAGGDATVAGAEAPSPDPAGTTSGA